MSPNTEDEDARPTVTGWLEDSLTCLAFFTRLPLVSDEERHRSPPDMSHAARAVPVAALAVGIIVALALAIGHLIGLTGLVAATLAVATGILATGALHEDGLSDTADGLGGGWTKKARLEIMRDSRIGTYGALGLGLSLIARIGAITGIMQRGGLLAAMLIVITAEIVSRSAAVWILWRLPAARRSGLSAKTGRPDDPAALQCFTLTGIAAFLLMATAAGVLATAFALAAAGLATLAMTALARHALGGQTGDIAGAAQQAALIAFLFAALAALPV
jgi:adenosylcobinamide-GDP ribazoletransferase